MGGATSVADLQAIQWEEDDWTGGQAYSPPYSLSKALLNRATQILSDDPQMKEKNISLVAICPGWCRTDMGGDQAPRSDEDGANSILRVLTSLENSSVMDRNNRGM